MIQLDIVNLIQKHHWEQAENRLKNQTGFIGSNGGRYCKDCSNQLETPTDLINMCWTIFNTGFSNDYTRLSTTECKLPQMSFMNLSAYTLNQKMTFSGQIGLPSQQHVCMISAIASKMDTTQLLD